MRQFTYSYRSYMKNRHGFINMIPHAKFLHSYMGFSGVDSQPIFRNASYVDYSKDFCDVFLSSNMVFEHKVKLFFPEVKHGTIAISDVKYSIDKEEEEDSVSVSHKIIEGPKYKEYYVIDDFSVEFIIEVSVDFGLRGSCTAPVSVFCDFIDVYINNQKISITTHDNNLLFVPYIMSYRTDYPLEVARLETGFTNIAVNSDQQYGFIVDEKTYDKLTELNLDPAPLDPSLLNTKKRIMGMISDAGNEGGIALNHTSISAYSGIGKKYIFTLPQAIFPDKMTLHGLPIFNSETSSDCCEHWGATWGSAYFEQYDVPIAASIPTPVDCDKTTIPCQEMKKYELRNKIVDGYIILSDKSWDELDMLSVGIRNSEKQRIAALEDYLEGVL